MKAYLVIEYGRDQNSYFCFEDEEAARKKAIDLTLDNALAYSDYEASKDPEKAFKEGIDAYYSISGDLVVELIDCELQLRGDGRWTDR